MSEFDLFDYMVKNMTVTTLGSDYMYAQTNEYMFLADQYEKELKVGLRDGFDRWATSTKYVFDFPDTWEAWESIMRFLDMDYDNGPEMEDLITW